ncbi:MAG: uroporphyrinogen-III synthase [Candidatus Omnitrophica bacterium]|nr:uroporphyrinogen-III synthase [Candidatus Omnitrophota bacterium]
MLFLKSKGVECETVPGISSCYAAAEVCGIPLTDRTLASGFMVLTGHEDPAKKSESVNWAYAAKFSGTIVIMMGLSNLKTITGKLLAGGKSADTPCAVIASGTTRKEKIITSTLRGIAAESAGMSSPAVCVIGDVVKLGYLLSPKLKPLAGKKYISTASDNLTNDISEKIKRLGGKVCSLPLIKIVPHKDISGLKSVIKNAKSYDWLVFTSRHGVYYFFKKYFSLGGNPSDIAGRVACVGSGTASELAKCGIEADLVPDVSTTKDLGLALLARGVKGKRIALLRTKMKRDVLKKMRIRKL